MDHIKLTTSDFQESMPDHKNQRNLILEAIEEYKLDALIITETVLQDNEEDNQWTKSSKLNTNGYQIQTNNRIKRRAKRITLILKDEGKITTLDTINYTSFEHKTWNMQFKLEPTYTITGIYHPHLTAKQMTIIQHSWTNSPTI